MKRKREGRGSGQISNKTMEKKPQDIKLTKSHVKVIGVMKENVEGKS